MKIEKPQSWPQTVEEAKAIQEELRRQVIREDDLPTVRYVAGVDAGYPEQNNLTQAAVAVLSFPELQLCDQAIAHCPTHFPYIPGFLSFREIPAVLEALEQLTIVPDLLLCDGQGLAHPRRLGIACHLGVLTNLPTIGVAKSRLIGTHDALPPERGSWQPLRDRGETVGAVLRSRSHVNPLYISIGHRISLPTALDYVMRCTPKYRLPETTRISDRLASS
ncbi:deoxyribonuclease V [Laspinema olomoucense]|uniref:deoxyribonuclease V n=1 Tax=Laspinema olomoucense TaxID=3231600 RepID=UPI0021BA6FB1|nr:MULTISPECIES: deoxyribonuclease V [unclassified Laspinema]MCT7974142.1 deoxyribonuclease V [Laspinema sp. D3d]MCT7987452.1 deoxyribonuclease V [Laspinema sp. D3a]MCT7993543.1 deoxyribonuclease V [Laspinema sp. D3c]